MIGHSNLIKQQALALGFSKVGIAKAEFLEEDYNYFLKYLKEGRHGKMAYLERNQEVRANPELLFANTKSVIAVVANYNTFRELKGREDFQIARYAWGKDYHVVIKNKLLQLGAFVQQLIPDAKTRSTVDTAPIFEKRWAQKAGLGWVGKNTLFLSPEFGSFSFIGLLLVDKELEYDQPFEKNRCGSCTRCLDACPTKALQSAGEINAVKCISYSTIEQKTVTNPTQKVNFIYGCDICQNVCPWNTSKHELPYMPEFEPNPEILNLTKEQLLSLSQEKFDEIFAETPVKRVGWERFKERARMVIGEE